MAKSCIPDFASRPSVSAVIIQGATKRPVIIELGDQFYRATWENRDHLRELEDVFYSNPARFTPHCEVLLAQGIIELVII
ncbi:MAG: hypothetical protein CO030_03645 [Candidatus Magasanikbacteria bacterium CG_4_9_14_0_2_um_filter_42_11]|uniref:Uncharacterized protein n=1 Tax=Candidatus Magasanikbacteria bacterium CG_4_9_14_0_2_um_filter_42_11 TaxID=1974643 RepID=A0A2M8F984_9BACT|nr:MAG: hypothetical protein COU34_02260 [Candidatus Magasanikbacteria bacterium CG10_big_fil_rev_8_21_14_0_10_43_9]PIY92695.1 MAG: hypothetical protein COY70_01885 [Candidatus Magasanikbacteria bacterium CG_4_10_14_0_8_um_filter_42_12]PJC52292.1 MAG: hypothetical protein CO030_03645 [Candidatus Magasanikbacteria bacterium CG_4_9_14_0_2_um_filter_42_11]